MKIYLTKDQIQQLRDEGVSFREIAESHNLTENTVKSRYYRENVAKPSRIRRKAFHLTEEQRKRAANLHYWGYPPCEICAEINAKAEDVRIYVTELPVHPAYRKKSA